MSMESTATPSSKFRIAIIGSGPIGKLLACSAPVHPRIELVQYEADTLPLRPSFGYGLGPQALTALKIANAELGRKIYDACILTRAWMRLYHGGDEDRLIADSMMPEGQLHGWIGRDELLELMDRNMPESAGSVRYGKQLSGVTQSGDLLELRFQDGTVDTANAIWACDGLNSFCRKVVQGPDYRPPVYSGKLCFRGKVAAQRVRAAIGDSFAEATCMFIGVTGWFILIFPIWGGDWINVVAFGDQPERKRVGRDTKITLEEVLSYFPGRNKTANAILQLLGDAPNGFQRLELMHLGQLGTYTNPGLCITTFGDAANAMLPYLAGSMATGIVGIAAFIIELKKRSEVLAPDATDHDIKTVLIDAAEAYEARHKPLAQKFVDLSVEQGTRCGGGVTDVEKLRENLYQMWNMAKTMGWS